MNKAPISNANWHQLFEASLTEQDPLLAAERFHSAKDAIMDHIEDSFESASLSERRILLAALNTISEFEGALRPGDLRPQASLLGRLGHAA